MHAENQTPFTQSKVLYAMWILGRSREEMAAATDGLAAGAKKKEGRAFDQKQAADLRSMTTDECLVMQKEFSDS